MVKGTFKSLVSFIYILYNVSIFSTNSKLGSVIQCSRPNYQNETDIPKVGILKERQ